MRVLLVFGGVLVSSRLEILQDVIRELDGRLCHRAGVWTMSIAVSFKSSRDCLSHVAFFFLHLPALNVVIIVRPPRNLPICVWQLFN